MKKALIIFVGCVICLSILLVDFKEAEGGFTASSYVCVYASGYYVSISGNGRSYGGWCRGAYFQTLPPGCYYVTISYGGRSYMRYIYAPPYQCIYF